MKNGNPPVNNRTGRIPATPGDTGPVGGPDNNQPGAATPGNLLGGSVSRHALILTLGPELCALLLAGRTFPLTINPPPRRGERVLIRCSYRDKGEYGRRLHYRESGWYVSPFRVTVFRGKPQPDLNGMVLGSFLPFPLPDGTYALLDPEPFPEPKPYSAYGLIYAKHKKYTARRAKKEPQ